MRTCKLSVVIFFSALVLFGCASSGPVYTPAQVPGGKAVIYFYRPAQFTLKGRTIFMAFPGYQHSHAMINEGYFPLVVNPGTIVVNAVGTDLKPVPFKIDVKKGDERFVIVRFADTLSLGVPAEYQEVPAAKGKGEIIKCTLISEAN
jgi:hypothetical protein